MNLFKFEFMRKMLMLLIILLIVRELSAQDSTEYYKNATFAYIGDKILVYDMCTEDSTIGFTPEFKTRWHYLGTGFYAVKYKFVNKRKLITKAHKFDNLHYFFVFRILKEDTSIFRYQ